MESDHHTNKYVLTCRHLDSNVEFVILDPTVDKVRDAFKIIMCFMTFNQDLIKDVFGE